MVPRMELKDAEAMRDAGKHHAPFIIPSMIFRQITQTQGWRSAWPQFRKFRAGLCACQESGKNAKTERRSITPSPPRARHGAAALREAPAERDLSMIMRRNIPRTARLNTLFPVPVRIPMTKPRKGTAPQSQWVCAAALNSQSTCESAAIPGKRRREGEQETRSRIPKPLPEAASPPLTGVFR